MKLEKIISTGRKIVSLTIIGMPLSFSGCEDVKKPSKPYTRSIPMQERVEETQAIPSPQITEQPVKTENIEQVVNKEYMERWKEHMYRYFPLAVGNTWKYKIIVPENVKVVKEYNKFQFFEAKEAISEFSPSLKPGEYILHFEVGKKVSQQGAFHKYKDGWEIKILQDDGKIYEDVENLFWNRTHQEDGTVKEIRVYSLEYTMSELGLSFGMLNLQINEPAEVWKSLYYFQPERMDEDRTIIINDKIFYKYLKRNQSVSVPAGRFDNVIVIEEEVKAEDYKIDGWKSLLFYAPNVGLIKNEREDLKGNILKTMELIDYKIK